MLGDIERCLAFLAGGKPPTISLSQAIEVARLAGWGKEVDAEHFTFKIFKKGTVHLRFKDERLLARLNIFGSQRKKWLPQSYGRVRYADMTTEERAVVDSYEGAEAYSKVVAEPEAYLLDTGRLLALPEPRMEVASIRRHESVPTRSRAGPRRARWPGMAPRPNRSSAARWRTRWSAM